MRSRGKSFCRTVRYPRASTRAPRRSACQNIVTGLIISWDSRASTCVANGKLRSMKRLGSGDKRDYDYGYVISKVAEPSFDAEVLIEIYAGDA